RPGLQGLGPHADRRRWKLPLPHDQAGCLSQPGIRQLDAPAAYPLLDLCSRADATPDHAAVLSRRAAQRRRSDPQWRRGSRGACLADRSNGRGYAAGHGVSVRYRAARAGRDDVLHRPLSNQSRGAIRVIQAMDHETAELLIRTSAGTPMGNLMRRYWVPVMLSSEIGE